MTLVDKTKDEKAITSMLWDLNVHKNKRPENA